MALADHSKSASQGLTPREVGRDSVAVGAPYLMLFRGKAYFEVEILELQEPRSWNPKLVRTMDTIFGGRLDLGFAASNFKSPNGLVGADASSWAVRINTSDDLSVFHG